MSERLFIKPAPQPEGEPALKVRKPVNGHLAADGEWVNAESYWLRRLSDDDVVLATDPQAIASAAAPTAAPVASKVSKAV